MNVIANCHIAQMFTFAHLKNFNFFKLNGSNRKYTIFCKNCDLQDSTNQSIPLNIWKNKNMSA